MKTHRLLFTNTIFVFICCWLLALPIQQSYGQDAIATVNFDQLSGRSINKGAFGLNLFQGFDPNQAGTPGNATYKAAMSFMNPGIVRYHSWEMLGQNTNTNGWLTSTNQWDAVKINNALSGANSYNPLVMMNIPAWPSTWQDASGKLLPAHYTDYANWCASLVRIVNIDQRRGYKYWEITNERDDLYALQCDELGRIYNQVAAAMKAVDPTIKTGGPAFARPDIIDHVDAFFSTAAPNLDFVTYHSYANGSPNSPTQQVYDKAVTNGVITSSMRTEFAKYSTRTIEYFHDEYNISWAPPNPHQTNYVSMIFDAILSITAIKDGATGTMAWNECDGWYGKMDNSYTKRPSAYLFNTFNANLTGGSVCNSTVNNAASLVVLASKKNSLLQVVVINRSDLDQRYKFMFTGLPAAVNNSTLFSDIQCLAAGGTSTKQLSYGQLTGGTGVLFEKNTVSLLSIDVNNLQSTGDLIAPSVPTSLRATSTDNSITLSWNASTDNVGVAGYDVYMNSAYLGSTNGSTTSYTATWLDASTSYAFRVKAKDATGNESALSASFSANTQAYTARPVASIFTATSWHNPFAGNVINDVGQTTTNSGNTALRQNGEMRIVLTNTNQYSPIYQSTFTNPINLSTNSDFSVNIRSNVAIALRVKLFDDAGNTIDAWQNSLYLSNDNTTRTYTLNFASTGFGSVNSSRVKGIVLMYPDGALINGTLFLDELKLGIAKTSTGTGLAATYFNNTTLTTPVALTRTDGPVNFDWGNGSPATGVNTDRFSVRWTGQVEPPVSGNYTFSTVSDDGVRLWVNGTQVINNWTDHAPTTNNSAAITLTGGQKYDIKMEFYENGGGAVAKLLWAYPGQAQQAIPKVYLYSTVAYSKITGTYFGTAPWSSNSTYDKAFDGNTSTFFDAATGNDGYTGVDVGTARVATRIRFHPRFGHALRMVGGKFQGSNTSTSSGFVDLYTLSSMPPDDWQQVDIPNTTGYRYLRYLSPMDGYANVAEIEFYTNVAGARSSFEKTVAAFGDVIIYPNPANEFTNLILPCSEAGEVSVTLTNSLGRHVTHIQKSVVVGENTFALPIAKLTSGLYVITIRQGDKQMVQKLIVEK